MKNSVKLVESTYAQIAAEYYDPVRHPTSANFRTASISLIARWFNTLVGPSEFICETGAGRSIAARLLYKKTRRLSNLLITDLDESMLAYSSCWARAGARLNVADARSLPVEAGSVGALVSSLADPYNDFRYWNEVRRVLRPSGLAIFTTPSYEWAASFRSGNHDGTFQKAGFETLSGMHILVPSYIYPYSEQIKLISDAGLKCVDFKTADIKTLGPQVRSPKLLFGEGVEPIVVSGYLIERG